MAKTKKNTEENKLEVNTNDNKKVRTSKQKKEETPIVTATLKDLIVEEAEIIDKPKIEEEVPSDIKKEENETEKINIELPSEEQLNVVAEKTEEKNIELINQSDESIELSSVAKKWKAYIEYLKMTPEQFLEKYPNNKFKWAVEELIRYKVKTNSI